MPGTADLSHRRGMKRAETGIEHVKGQTLNITDLEVKYLFMSTLLLLGEAESGHLSLLCHICSRFDLHQEAVFVKLPHFLDQWQVVTLALLVPAPSLRSSWPLPGALGAADLPPAHLFLPPRPPANLVFLGTVFSDVWFKSLHE